MNNFYNHNFEAACIFTTFSFFLETRSTTGFFLS